MHLASSVHAPTCLYDAFGRTKTPRTHTLARAHTHRNYTRTAHSCNRNLTFESEFVDSVFYTPINNSRFLFTGFYARYYSDLSFFFFLFILMIFHLRSLWKIWFFVSELFDTIEHYFEHSNSFFFCLSTNDAHFKWNGSYCQFVLIQLKNTKKTWKIMLTNHIEFNWNTNLAWQDNFL